MSHLGLRLTPHGHLVLEQADDAPGLDPTSAARLADAFARGTGPGLLQLGAGEVGQALPPAFAWWRGFVARYVTALCLHAPDTDADAPSRAVLPVVAAPDAADLAALSLTAPMMPGSEYLTPEVLLAFWAEMAAAAATGFAAADADLQSFLKTLNPAWNLVGRVHFNLAENRRDADFPFAFMTSAARMQNAGRAMSCRMSTPKTATRAAFTPGERDYVRRELDQFFSTLPSVADGF